MRGEALIDIESIYVRYGPMVLRRCRRMLKNEQSAYDAMHEVFLKILSNQNRLTAEYLDDYKNLSFRAERRFNFAKTNLVIYVGAWNIFDHQNELYRFWDSYGNQYLSEYMWGVIPYIGLEFQF